MNESKPLILLINILSDDLNIIKPILDSADFIVKEWALGEEYEVLSAGDVILLGVHNSLGIETLQSIKSKEIPILLLADKAEFDNAQENLSTRVDCVLKPIYPTILLNRIRNYIVLAQNEKQLDLCEQNLQQVLVEKDNFVSVASHDLRNPINVISGIVELINMTFNAMTSEDLKEYLYMIERSCQRMKQITGNLLDIHRLEAGKLSINTTNFSPYYMLLDLIKSHTMHAHEKNITLNFAGDYPSLVLNSDFDLVTQIMDNLISNAIKYSPQDKQIYLELSSKDDSIIFKVKDEGPGFTEKDKEKLFQKFVKLSAQPTGDEVSTGLGLSIVKQLTDCLHGEISCQSQHGEGAEFIVSFPLLFPEENKVG